MFLFKSKVMEQHLDIGDQKGRVVRNITQYLNKKENNGDDKARVLRMLYKAKELLEEEGNKEKKKGKEGINRSTKVILRNIEDRLIKIKKRGRP